MRRRTWLWMVVLTACSPSLTLEEGTLVRCDSDDDCPSELVCKASLGRCVRPGSDDVAPRAENITLSTPRLGRDQILRVELDASEALAEAPSVVLEVGNEAPLRRALTLESRDVLHYVYSYQVQNDEPETSATLVVSLLDAAGNSGGADLPRVVTLDLTAPALVSSNLRVTPDPANPLYEVEALRDGARASVSFYSSEPLVGTPSLAAACDPVALSFTRRAGESSTTFFTFERELAAADEVQDGDCPLVASIVDEAGNANEVTLESVLSIDRTAPVAELAIDVAAFLHLRVPWGAARTAGLAAQFLAPVQVSATDPLPLGARESSSCEETPTLCFPSGALAQEGETLVEARVYSRGDAGGLVAQIAPQPAGWPSVRLATVDAAALYVSVIDHAGNESARARVPLTEWVATLGNKEPQSTLENPHAFYARAALQSTQRSLADVEPADVAALALPDEVTTTVKSAASWRRAEASTAWPRARSGAALAFDPVRARVVLYGGSSSQGADILSDVQWEWDGRRFIELERFDPEGDGNPDHNSVSGLAVFDSVRQRVVVCVESDDDLMLPALWEWNGASWQKVRASEGGDGPRYCGRMAFDSARARLVMFSVRDVGVDLVAETWEWDGARWLACTSASADCPLTDLEADGSPAWSGNGNDFVFDGAHGEALLRQSDAMWTWNGQRWARCDAESEVCPVVDLRGDGEPGDLYGSLVFDARREVVIFLGSAEWGDLELWEWDGAEWALIVHEALEGGSELNPLRATSLVYDDARGVTLLFGGQSMLDFSNSDGLWAYDGVSFSRVRKNDEEQDGEPVPRSGAAMVYDSLRDRVLMLGGQGFDCDDGLYCSDMWSFDGASLARCQAGSTACPLDNPSSFPSSRSRGAMTYDRARDRVVLFGGYSNGACDGGSSALCTATWEFDGLAWQKCEAGNLACPLVDAAGDGEPEGRTAAGLAYDPLRGRVVLFGGYSNEGCELAGEGPGCDYTWEWDGSEWRLVNTGGEGQPSARGNAFLTFDPLLGEVVLTGGETLGGDCDLVDYGACTGVWSWNGVRWLLRSADAGYGDRYEHSVFFDHSRASLAMYGGISANLDVLEATSSYGARPLVDPEGDGNPFTADGHMVYRDASHTGFFLGDLAGAWEWNAGAYARAAHVARFDFVTSGGPSPLGCSRGVASCPIERMDVLWRATASGGAPRALVLDYGARSGVDLYETLQADALTRLGPVEAGDELVLEVHNASDDTGVLDAWCLVDATGTDVVCQAPGRTIDAAGVTSDALAYEGQPLHTFSLRTEIAHSTTEKLSLVLTKTARPGAELLVWRPRGFERVAASTDGTLTYSLSTPADFASAFVERAESVYVAAAARSPAGTGESVVQSDYVELSVRYRDIEP